MKVFLLLLTAVIAYFLGGLNGAIISSMNFFHRDVRNYGSGNAGLTNYLRTFGTGSVAMVLLIDIAKSVIAIAIGGWLLHFQDAATVGKLFAGFCLIIGHMYPIYYHFQGGKGVLCAGVLAFMVDWRVGVGCLTIFLLIVIFTRYVSLGSMVGALFCPIFLWIFGYSTLEGLLALFSAALIVVKHAENILRLIGGTENKLNFKGGAGTRPPRGDGRR